MKLKVNKKSKFSSYDEIQKQLKMKERYPSRFVVKKYTVKEWKRFNPNIQAELSRRYTVILTDHKSRDEKIKMIKGKIKQGITNFGTAPSGGELKRSYGSQYLNTEIKIRHPNSLGMFDMNFGKKGKTNDFSNLATFK